MGGIARKKKKVTTRKEDNTQNVSMYIDDGKPKGKEGLGKSYKLPNDLLRGAVVSVGRFEPQLSHRSHKIRLL